MYKNWKSRALEKQLAYKAHLGLTKSGTHGGKSYAHILANEDAGSGANFYCHDDGNTWEQMQLWAGKKSKFLKNGLKNMLRSEHIAYNLFYPLEQLRIENPKKLSNLLAQIIGTEVSEVNCLKIEYAGGLHKSKLLDDGTSFDAYVEFVSEGQICGAGVEIKYTEKSYPYGTTEKAKLVKPDSTYMVTARNSGYFYDFNSDALKSRKLKQPFRNHLLGISMVKNKELKIQRFYSIHLFPESNEYQKDVAFEYLNELKEEYKRYFVCLTFEDLVSKLDSTGIEGGWVDYFKNRY